MYVCMYVCLYVFWLIQHNRILKKYFQALPTTLNHLNSAKAFWVNITGHFLSPNDFSTTPLKEKEY